MRRFKSKTIIDSLCSLSILLFLASFQACTSSPDVKIKWDGNEIHASEVTLEWEGRPEPGLAGYKVYYESYKTFHGNPFLRPPSYNGTEAAEGDSPIKVPLAELKEPYSPKFTMHGLDKTQIYFFTVTTYTDDKESLFSNQVYFPSETKK